MKCKVYYFNEMLVKFDITMKDCQILTGFGNVYMNYKAFNILQKKGLINE